MNSDKIILRPDGKELIESLSNRLEISFASLVKAEKAEFTDGK